MHRGFWITLSLAAALGASPARAGEESLPDWLKTTKLSAELFGDAYFMAANHDEAIEDASGFWIRRINLSVDSKLQESFTARLRFEMNASGDFKTGERMVPYTKDAWIRYRGGPTSVQFGLFGTPTWELVEKTWGYRSVEKTAVELQRLGASRDLGIGVQGSAASGKLSYNIMAGNGSDGRNETNEGKKLYGALAYRPGKPWVVEAYADFEARPGDTDRRTLQGFVAYQRESGRVGLTLARQNRQAKDGNDTDIDILSAFGVRKLNARLALLARYDRMFDPNPDGPGIAYLPFAGAKSSLAILGVDIRLLDAVHLIPNLEYIRYDGDDAPDADLMLRLTVLWSL